jgi:hypothetical protein
MSSNTSLTKKKEKKENLSLLRAGGEAYIVEHPPSKHKALSSNPSTVKGK